MRTLKTMMGAALGATLLAVPLMMPTAAHADDVRVSLNFGTPAVYRPAPVAVRYVPVAQPVIVRQAYVVPPRRMAWHGPRHDWRREQAWNWHHQHGYPVAYRW